MKAAILTRDLTRRFAGRAAVDGLNLEVARGEIFGLVGPDGAGKTTTMRLLASILPPSSGGAWVSGHHVVEDPEAIKRKIGYMSQRFGLYADLTVMENITFYADIYGAPRAGRSEKIERLLSFSNLGPFRRRQAGKLSGGMKQKLGLACALVHTPEVLLLDEPTNGVDPVSRRDFWKILYRLLRDGVTIFVSTAYLDEAERCSRVGLLHGGRLLATGPPDDVKELVRGQILEIQCSHPRRAATLLRDELAGSASGLFGDKVHLFTEDPERSGKETGRILEADGIRVQGTRVVPPTLEDVFVSMMDGGGRKP